MLLPWLGMERSLFLLAALYAAVAWLARAPRTGPAPLWPRVLAPLALVWSLVLLGRLETAAYQRLAGLWIFTSGVSILVMLYRGYFND